MTSHCSSNHLKTTQSVCVCLRERERERERDLQLPKVRERDLQLPKSKRSGVDEPRTTYARGGNTDVPPSQPPHPHRPAPTRTPAPPLSILTFHLNDICCVGQLGCRNVTERSAANGIERQLSRLIARRTVVTLDCTSHVQLGSLAVPGQVASIGKAAEMRAMTHAHTHTRTHTVQS